MNSVKYESVSIVATGKKPFSVLGESNQLAIHSAKANGADAEVWVSINNQKHFPMVPKETIRFDAPFQRVEFWNKTAFTMTLRVKFTDGQIQFA